MNDLDKRQVSWQNWRNQLYSDMTRASRDAQALDRHSERIMAKAAQSIRPGYQTDKAMRENDEAHAEAKRLSKLYDQAVHLDTALKNARHQHNDGAYVKALEACEVLAQQGY